MLQLNPHFIFNSLNHIQYFINNGEKAVALSYVSRFSKFMRQLTTLSNTNYCTIQEELLLIGRYLELEKIRFENKFDYSITIPRNTGADDVQIPSLILYRLVEDIVYGRVLKSLNSVFIKINFDYRQSYIFFTLEDNIPLQGQDTTTQQLNMLNNIYSDSIVATQAVVLNTDNSICGSLLEVKFDTTTIKETPVIF